MLSVGTPGVYLHHRSALGEFQLSSDTVVPSFRKHPLVAEFRSLMPEEEIAEFNFLGHTIGATMVWPAQRVNGKNTINGARGFHPRIKDRFDLTLECVRRYYVGQTSPLAEVLERYASFFALFRDFAGFVEFFLLRDAVDAGAVRFSMPFDGFEHGAVPESVDAYRAYKANALAFIRARNERIDRIMNAP